MEHRGKLTARVVLHNPRVTPYGREVFQQAARDARVVTHGQARLEGIAHAVLEVVGKHLEPGWGVAFVAWDKRTGDLTWRATDRQELRKAAAALVEHLRQGNGQ